MTTRPADEHRTAFILAKQSFRTAVTSRDEQARKIADALSLGRIVAHEVIAQYVATREEATAMGAAAMNASELWVAAEREALDGAA